jgi:hypothetical protein
VDYDLSVVPQNRQEDEDGVRHVSRSGDLLRLEASWARIFQSSLKTGGGAHVDGASGIIIEVTWR